VAYPLFLPRDPVFLTPSWLYPGAVDVDDLPKTVDSLPLQSASSKRPQLSTINSWHHIDCTIEDEQLLLANERALKPDLCKFAQIRDITG
jgi:hypothetical protein